MRVLDLFCGAGGLSLGFEKAGFEIVGGVEFDSEIIKTHERNFPHSISICDDIRNISDERVVELFGKSVDGIIGGPPCQGFSSANMWQTDEEKIERNRLFFEYIRFIKLLKPKFFVIENVKQILTKENGFAKNQIYEITKELGYSVNSEVLVASDYGVPQKRERAIFVGIRNDYNFLFSFDTLRKRRRVTVGEAISDLYNLEDCGLETPSRIQSPPKSDYQRLMRARSNDSLYNHTIKYPNEIVQERMKYVPQGGNWKDVPEEMWTTKRDNRHSSAYKRLSENELSITIDTGHMNYFHPLYNRTPTVRESARIQSFPDDFVFLGSKTSQFTQVGNAVPPLMAQALAEAIKTSLVNLKHWKIIDLFCGAGGLSLGFEKAGFESVLAIDKWQDAITTYNNNRENKTGSTIDIHDYSNSQLEEINKLNNVIGIVGGPPCQGFSLVGTRETNDPRNSLYMEYVRFVSVISPSFFVLENVAGLLSLGKGKYKEDIISRFTDLGYNVNYKLLRASDYGVPQARKRVIFVGLKKDLFGDRFFDFDSIEKKEMVSTENAIGDLPSLKDEVSSSVYDKEPQNQYQLAMRKNNEVLHNHEKTIHTKQTIDIISMVPDGGTIKDLPEEYYKVRNYNNAFRRMDSKLPSNTIDCGHRNYFHYKENRIPTVRESARIQSFPDSYVFYGSRTSQYTQVGNAVPVLLAYAIAEAIQKTIE